MDNRAGIVFLILGIAFFGIAASGQRGFLAAGVAFLVVGLVLLKRRRSARRP